MREATADELSLEAVAVLHLGHVFEDGDSAEELAFRVAHGSGAEAIAALRLADAHGQQGGFAFVGDGSLHGDGFADGA